MLHPSGERQAVRHLILRVCDHCRLCRCVMLTNPALVPRRGNPARLTGCDGDGCFLPIGTASLDRCAPQLCRGSCVVFELATLMRLRLLDIRRTGRPRPA